MKIPRIYWRAFFVEDMTRINCFYLEKINKACETRIRNLNRVDQILLLILSLTIYCSNLTFDFFSKS